LGCGLCRSPARIVFEGSRDAEAITLRRSNLKTQRSPY
jgi:hypothetical protein